MFNSGKYLALLNSNLVNARETWVTSEKMSVKLKFAQKK